MSADDTITMLVDSLERALGDVVSPAGTVAAQSEGIDRRAWSRLADLGLIGAVEGGLSLRETVAVVRALARVGALVPYADSEGLARWLAGYAGVVSEPDEILAVIVAPAGTVERHPAGWRLRCAGLALHASRQASRLLVSFEAEGRAWVGVTTIASLAPRIQANIAGEPLDLCGAAQAELQGVVAVAPNAAPTALWRRGALLRAAAMLGAAEQLLAITLRYAQDRQQFGRSLSAFQVVQSHLAEMAGELASAGAMLETALVALDLHGGEDTAQGDGAEIAALKIRAGQAAQTIAAHAHQLHGAIGFTQEYPLQIWSRRLWAWREEYGNESHWADTLGASLLSIGADDFWPRITR